MYEPLREAICSHYWGVFDYHYPYVFICFIYQLLRLVFCLLLIYNRFSYLFYELIVFRWWISYTCSQVWVLLQKDTLTQSRLPVPSINYWDCLRQMRMILIITRLIRMIIIYITLSFACVSVWESEWSTYIALDWCTLNHWMLTDSPI